mmetsp:Transcript_23300/g.88342  ORF Transcript_23300/g.88342 Transcript_23300/m.88342 type:complete len:448 (-) Transcript_23300:131-1474(-)
MQLAPRGGGRVELRPSLCGRTVLAAGHQLVRLDLVTPATSNAREGGQRGSCTGHVPCCPALGSGPASLHLACSRRAAGCSLGATAVVQLPGAHGPESVGHSNSDRHWSRPAAFLLQDTASRGRARAAAGAGHNGGLWGTVPGDGLLERGAGRVRWACGALSSCSMAVGLGWGLCQGPLRRLRVGRCRKARGSALCLPSAHAAISLAAMRGPVAVCRFGDGSGRGGLAVGPGHRECARALDGPAFDSCSPAELVPDGECDDPRVVGTADRNCAGGDGRGGAVGASSRLGLCHPSAASLFAELPAARIVCRAERGRDSCGVARNPRGSCSVWLRCRLCRPGRHGKSLPSHREAAAAAGPIQPDDAAADCARCDGRGQHTATHEGGRSSRALSAFILHEHVPDVAAARRWWPNSASSRTSPPRGKRPRRRCSAGGAQPCSCRLGQRTALA